MSPFSLRIYKGNERMGIQKIRKRGIRGSENKGNEEKGYPLDACCNVTHKPDLRTTNYAPEFPPIGHLCCFRRLRCP
jgi:hypothetical protein